MLHKKHVIIIDNVDIDNIDCYISFCYNKVTLQWEDV